MAIKADGGGLEDSEICRVGASGCDQFLARRTNRLRSWLFAVAQAAGSTPCGQSAVRGAGGRGGGSGASSS